MAGTSNFKIFDENKSNIMNDTDYAASTYRQYGATPGRAPSNLHNKMFRQATIMAAALAQVLANRGATVSDSDFTALVSALNVLVDETILAEAINPINIAIDTINNLITSTATANKLLKLDSNAKLPADITGNSATATALQTARNINGVSFNGTSDITIPATGNVSGLKGTVAHGGTIPLPSGYTQDQCIWTVSPGTISVNYDGSGSTIDYVCSADSNRVVTYTATWASHSTWTGTANYIIIGVK